MELKYIWIKEYAQLKTLNVNFNHQGNEKFSYDGKTLSITRSARNVLDFGPKITGVTALAGQNGAGKSNLCQIVLHSLATYREGLFGYDITFEGIACYDECIFYHHSLQIENRDEINQNGYQLVEYDESPLQYLAHHQKLKLRKGGFIYYSNLLDFATSFEDVNLRNISSTNLLHEEVKRTTLYFRNYDSFSQPYYRYLPKDHRSELRIYELGEGFRGVRYYVNNFERLDFKGPEHLLIKSAYSQNNRWLKTSESDGESARMFDRAESGIFAQLVPYKSVSRQGPEGKVKFTTHQLRQLTMQLYRLNLARIQANRHGATFTDEQLYYLVNDGRLADGEQFGELKTLMAIHQEICTLGSFMDDAEFDPYHMQARYEDHMEDWRFTLLENIFLPNSSKGRELIKKLIDAEQTFLNPTTVHGVARISNYLFPDFFSSGEQAYISLFSRLDEAIAQYRLDEEPGERLTIFIDEGDAGFHPKWSKLYFKWILDFLNNRTEALRFQLIFSTHSPYLLSDLSAEHIILLQRNAKNETEILSHDNFETFGANIHDLLSNHFFLEDGTIGEYAKLQINGVIEKLNAWRNQRSDNGADSLANISQEEKSNTLRLISCIADYIVRGKLFEMYEELFQETSATQREIEYLEQRIRKLKDNDRN